MSESRTKISPFWIVLGIFAVAYIIFWVIFINTVIVKDLNIYNESQPEVVMEEVVAKIAAGDISAMDFASSGSRFEDGNIYRDTFAANIQGKAISFRENEKSYDAQAPIYDILADGEVIATSKLVVATSEPLMMILAKTTWNVESITPIYEMGNEGVIIEIPNSYTAYVNGVQVDDREFVESIDYSEFVYAKEYVEVPTKSKYEITGLMTKPSVKICDANGNEVSFEENGAKYTAGFVATQISDDMAAYVLNNAKVYSNFFSRDLPGCDNSINGIRYMFPADSDYLTLAENYRLHDMWMYSGHGTPTFSNEAVTEYIQYSDVFFQVNVYFDKSMTLTRTGDVRVDTTNSTYYYVYIDGAWVIADMISIIAE